MLAFHGASHGLSHRSLTSTLGSANEAPKALLKLSGLQPCTAAGPKNGRLERAGRAPSLGTDGASQSQPPSLAAADIRPRLTHQLSSVCYGICRAFPQSQDNLHFPGTFSTAVRASLGRERPAGRGQGQTGWEVGLGQVPPCQGGGGGPLPQMSFATLGRFAASPLQCRALC